MKAKTKRRKLKKTIVLPKALPHTVELELHLPTKLADPVSLTWEQQGKRLLIQVRDFVLGGPSGGR